MENFFGKNLRYLREQRKIEQQEFADKLGIPRTTLACWELGTRTPKIKKVREIAEKLNVDIDIISRDFSLKEEDRKLKEVELLFSKHRDILTKDDEDMIKFIIEKRKREVDSQEEVCR